MRSKIGIRPVCQSLQWMTSGINQYGLLLRSRHGRRKHTALLLQVHHDIPHHQKSFIIDQIICNFIINQFFYTYICFPTTKIDVEICQMSCLCAIFPFHLTMKRHDHTGIRTDLIQFLWKVPITSASPPSFTNGAHSAPASSTFSELLLLINTCSFRNKYWMV